jgi:HEAT repeat protein
MKHAAPALVIVAALAVPAMAHGGGYGGKPPGGGEGPQAGPGFGDPAGPVTQWESWWRESREDLLRVAERVDSVRLLATTPGGDGPAAQETPASRSAARAASVREDVIPHLLAALRDADYDVRSSAAIALGKTGDRRGAAPLKDAAKRDERGDVRRAALFGLGILGRKQELPFLCDVVADKKAEMDDRSAAALGVGLLGGDDAACFLAFFMERDGSRPDLRNATEAQFGATVYAALGLTGSVEALRTLWRAADDETLSPFVRAHAVLSLGRLRDRDSTARCVKLAVAGTDPQFRRAAIVALGRCAAPEDADAVRALTDVVVDDRDGVARRFAILALGGIRDGTVRGVLRAGFETAAAPEKPSFALALAMQADAMSGPAIRAALKDEHELGARAAYCTALALLGDRDSIPALEREVGPGPTPGTYRGFAAIGLGILSSTASADVIWKRLPQENDARVWGDYCLALGLLGDERVRGFLTRQLTDGANNYDRCRAASCLGVLRRADAVPDLVAMFRDRNAPGIVRALCVVALGQIADESVVPKLSRLSSGGGSTLATRVLAEAMGIL